MKKWPSPAKLNLFLYITGQRKDGYHNLQTLFQFIDACDYLTFELRQDNEICLTTEIFQVKHDDNLIIKSASLLLHYAKEQQLPLPTHYGVDISIDKKLPIGGGLGGGSSNAATTLVALNQLWGLNLPKSTLMQIGCQLGADIPIFVFGHSAFAQGIGDELQDVEIAENWYLIIKPNVEIATVSIFKHADLKRDTVTRTCRQLLSEPFHNDCEPTVRKLYPQIDNLIKLLNEQAPTRLTGTGACLFCECDSEEQAKALQLYLHQYDANEKITSFVAKGVNRSPLFT